MSQSSEPGEAYSKHASIVDCPLSVTTLTSTSPPPGLLLGNDFNGLVGNAEDFGIPATNDDGLCAGQGPRSDEVSPPLSTPSGLWPSIMGPVPVQYMGNAQAINKCGPSNRVAMMSNTRVRWRERFCDHCRVLGPPWCFGVVSRPAIRRQPRHLHPPIAKYPEHGLKVEKTIIVNGASQFSDGYPPCTFYTHTTAIDATEAGTAFCIAVTIRFISLAQQPEDYRERLLFGLRIN